MLQQAMRLTMGDEQPETPSPIREAIKLIGNYPAVKSVKDVSVGQCSVVETDWVVKLPNMYRRRGISDTGVREVETVYWHFPLDYPQHAPSPQLRSDFPTSLPHLNPHKPGELVHPCISESPLEDLLHSVGLPALFDAVSQWLNNAAADELHCPVQGWEHVRRDNIKGLIHADTHAIRADLDTSTDVVKFYNYQYYRVENSDDFLMGELMTPSLGASNAALKKKNLGIDSYTSIRNSPGVLFQTENGKVYDKYRPETVHDFKSLRNFAKELDLQHAFDARLKYILTVSSPHAMQKQNKAPVEEFMVVFAVKRPFNLIGTESPWELLAYRVLFSQKHDKVVPGEAIVRSTQLIQKSCPQLLQAVSGEKVNKPVKLGLLGCGSLGSKVALHAYSREAEQLFLLNVNT